MKKKKIDAAKTVRKYKVKKSSAGLGLFAEKPFKKSAFIIEYAGKLLRTEEADKKGGKYLFRVSADWTIDGTGRENLARYINHSCRPNCEPWICGRKIKIYARKKIISGEELTYDYGKEYFDEYIKSHGCRCRHCHKKSNR